ncbi:MAG: coproporphyrinogen dehydrogenase HemZ, partial [Clostridia bacterium]|nr:coproporphyrinogen dehydrogenase HemZ [Clostridia bacterium]
DYFNDLAEEIRLFFDTVEVPVLEEKIAPEAGDFHIFAELTENNGVLTAVVHTLNAEDPSIVEKEYIYSGPAHHESILAEKKYEKRALKIAVFRVLAAQMDGYTPWGSLTGIRPTRLFREMMEESGMEEARRIMKEEFDVSEPKLALTEDIVRVQLPLLAEEGAREADVYIGIPFCRSRCLYCSFAAEVRGKKTDVSGYIEALKRDIDHGARILKEGGWHLRSMYIGGGTPTALTASELDEVLTYALEAYGGSGMEFTVEAGRPDTIDREKLEILKKLGVGRISINPQSMNALTLERIGRSHSPESIIEAYELAKEIGFDSINMDLIAGLPGETVADMANTLDAIAKLKPENLTVHTLAVKRSSKLRQRLEEFPLPGASVTDEMVALAAAAAKDYGMRPYYMYRQKYMRGNLENVGYAIPGKECIYNIDMMEETTSIMAHGAGSMSKRVFGGEHRVERIPNPKDLATYIAKIDIVAAEKEALYRQ